MCSTLNEIMNKRMQKNKLLPKEFTRNNSEEIINPHEIANKFNEYFIRTFNDYLSNKCQNSFFIEPVTKLEVEVEIKNLN